MSKRRSEGERKEDRERERKRASKATVKTQRKKKRPAITGRETNKKYVARWPRSGNPERARERRVLDNGRQPSRKRDCKEKESRARVKNSEIDQVKRYV